MLARTRSIIILLFIIYFFFNYHFFIFPVSLTAYLIDKFERPGRGGVQSHRVRMRSLGDVSAQPAKGLRHPEKGPEKGQFWDGSGSRFWVSFGRRLRGGAKKGLKRARSYIYIATRAFWALFGAWGGSCKGQPRRARKGPPTSPLLTGGTRRVVAHNEKPTKRPKSQKGKIVKKGEIGQKEVKWQNRRKW